MYVLQSKFEKCQPTRSRNTFKSRTISHKFTATQHQKPELCSQKRSMSKSTTIGRSAIVGVVSVDRVEWTTPLSRRRRRKTENNVSAHQISRHCRSFLSAFPDAIYKEDFPSFNDNGSSIFLCKPGLVKTISSTCLVDLLGAEPSEELSSEDPRSCQDSAGGDWGFYDDDFLWWSKWIQKNFQHPLLPFTNNTTLMKRVVVEHKRSIFFPFTIPSISMKNGWKQIHVNLNTCGISMII